MSAWATSDRRSRLPKDWAKRVAATKRRAQGRCEALHHDPDCDGTGSQCDHIVRGDDHSLTNLQWLSEPCHRVKTLLEAKAGRRPPRKRTPRRHPSDA